MVNFDLAWCIHDFFSKNVEGHFRGFCRTILTQNEGGFQK